jgi:RNA polymerase sigma-B factor
LTTSGWGRPLREEIIAAYTPLIERILLDFRFSGIPADDLMQVGYLGLLNAIELFDPARGVKFKTYASHLIRGEIRHYLRDHRDTIRKPRWLRRLNQQIEETVGRYLSQEGRYPRLEELSAELNVGEDGLLEILKTREALRTVSLEAEEEADHAEIDRRRIRHRTYASFQLPIEDRIVLHDAMEKLSLLQRRVLYHLFFADLTQPEVARRIGISQRHVSRVLSKSLTRLRAMLGGS